MPSCRSSGVQTASAVISGSRVKLISIHAQLTGGAPTTVRVFDNASAGSGKVLARIIMENPNDMHGVIASY